MKKLMIALAAVAIGFAANAASYSWSAQSGRLMNGTGESGSANYITSGTAYLLFTDVMSQADLVSAFAADASAAASTVATKALSSGTIGSDARVGAQSFTADATSDKTAYFVVFNGDNMYVSMTATAEYMSVGESPIEFDSLTASSRALPTAATAGYSDAGYTAVPEPTSGLLMLLGMAGLALRRRRA